ncbi:MAG: major facilitator superfamily 1 [Myxococcales bacterium]|nr:major facilitator superfamily 1 [Myxococcales bacterium]
MNDERRAALWAAAYHFLLLAAYYTVRPLRDAMGLRGSVKTLPWLFAGTLAVMVVTTPIFAALVERMPRRRFVPLIYHFFAANLVAFFFVLRADPSTTAARVFFIWTSIFNLFAVSVFWGFMADRFDAASAARRYGWIAFGGTLGAMAGAGLTSLLAERIGAANLTLVAALLLEAAVLCFYQVARGHIPSLKSDIPHRPVWTFAAKLVRSPYLLAIAGYMLLYTITSTFAYLEQARLAQSAVHGDAARTALFARMDLYVNLFSLILQVTATGFLLRRAGVTITLLILPAVTLVGFAALAVHPSLAAIIAFQVARRTSDYFAARPARELCYVVVGREEKYAAKSFIDTFIYRGGDALGASAFGLVGVVAPVVALPLCAVWIVVALFLGQRQKAERQKLESRAVSASS